MFRTKKPKTKQIKQENKVPAGYCTTCKKKSSKCNCFAKKMFMIFIVACIGMFLLSCASPQKKPKDRKVIFTLEFTYDGVDVEGYAEGNFPKQIISDIRNIQAKLQANLDIENKSKKPPSSDYAMK